MIVATPGRRVGCEETPVLQTAADLSLPMPSPVAARRPEADAARVAWIKTAIVGGGLIALYWRNLDRLWDKTNPISGDPNWYHAICVPLIGIYYLFLHRDVLAATPAEPLLGSDFRRPRFISAILTILIGLGIWALSKTLPQTGEGLTIIAPLIGVGGLGLVGLGALVLLMDWGLATLLAGLGLTVYAIHPLKNDFAWDVAMILTLFGVVLTLCGWKIMRIAWFPILFLVCALPWPPLVYSKIASPLQVLAAEVSTVILRVAGIDSSVQGTKIFIAQFDNGIRLTDRALDVAEACAGLRSLMTFISVASAVAFLSSRPLWQKLVIAASAVPIAIGCNVLRVGGQGILDTYVGKEWSEGFAHQFAGMVMLLPAFFLILLVCYVVDHLFIEEADAPDVAPVAKAAA
jgi:exosortase